MNWINRLERWLESVFARVFAGSSQAVVGGNPVVDRSSNAEEGQVVVADRSQKLQVDRKSDSFVSPGMVGEVPKDDVQSTSCFVLPSERKKSKEETVADKTIRWKRPKGYILEVVKGSESGANYRGVFETCLIGRSEDCDFVLSDATVSKHHARIGADGTGWFVEDLGSTNGTYVNGKLVSKAYLKSEDTLKLGLTELRFWSLENEQ